VATVLIIDDSRHGDVDAHIDADRVLVEAESLESAVGWTLKPEGLCRGDVCVPVRDRSRLVTDNGLVDVEAVASALGRPVVVDAARGVMAIGEAADTRAEQMRSLRAPDFTLPDLDGNPVSLHTFDRRKVLLLAWSSW
jgi:hypothetical protein